MDFPSLCGDHTPFAISVVAAVIHILEHAGVPHAMFPSFSAQVNVSARRSGFAPKENKPLPARDPGNNRC